jgi:membrane-bound metal-dependent hydrolase YbcI (DUF457 family)
MAGFKTHITTSTLLGVAYGAVGAWYWQLDWGTTVLAGGLTALGGMLPDLDSDSGVPVREMSGLLGAATPFLILPRVRHLAITMEQQLVVLACAYLLVRYGVSQLFKRFTVHRGMFHSVPAMLIAGLCVFLLFPERDLRLPAYLALGVMVGFLSHLLLDEIYAVDLNGLTPKLNQFAGTALKLTSGSLPATLLTYAILSTLAWTAYNTKPEPGPANEPTAPVVVRPRTDVRVLQGSR